MFKIIVKSTLLLFILLLQNCIPVLRSSKGLDPGELSICYNAPYAGDIRVGITKYSEIRYSKVGEGLESDLMFHYRHNLDYALAIGLQWDPDHDEDYYFLPHNIKESDLGITGIISKELAQRFNPYIGFSLSKPFKGKFESPGFEYFYTIGCETRILRDRDRKFPFNFYLTPEFVYIPQGTGGEYNTNFWGSLGMGIILDFEKIVKSLEEN
jgi:hypothetical protein